MQDVPGLGTTSFRREPSRLATSDRGNWSKRSRNEQSPGGIHTGSVDSEDLLVLKPHGRALFWSARPDPAFGQRLARAGFDVRVVPAPLYASAKRCAVSIYMATKITNPSA